MIIDNDIVKKKLQNLFKEYHEILAVYVFGSSLNEEGVPPNDIDLAILFRKNTKNDVKYYMELYDKLSNILKNIEVDLLFMHSAKLPMAFEIISTGRVIYSADDNLRTDFEDMITAKYLDFKYHLQRSHHEFYEGLMEGEVFV